MNQSLPFQSYRTFEQAGTIPWKITDGKAFVLLVTSRSNGKWIFPKGTIENGLSAIETAEKETAEEAGVRGRIHPKPAGEYSYRKNGKAHRVQLFWLEVVEEMKIWPEMDRERKWVEWTEAVGFLNRQSLKVILKSADKPWKGKTVEES